MSKNTSSRIRHRLTLQQEIQTPDGAGGTTKTWQDVADVWGEITALGSASSSSSRGGKESLMAAQLESNVTHRVLLRYRDGVTAAMRLVFDSRIFNIRSVVNTDERNNTLELLVQEGVAT